MTAHDADRRRCSSTASCRGSRSTSACSRKRPTRDAAARARQVRGDRRVEPRRVLHGARGRRCKQAIDDGRRRRRDLGGLTPAAAARRRSRERAHAFVDALYALTRDELLPALADARHPHRRRRPTLERVALAARRVLPRRRAAGADAAGDRRLAAVSAALVAQPEPRVPARRRPPVRRGRGSRSCRCRPACRGSCRVADADGTRSCCSKTIIRAAAAAAVPRPGDPRVGGHPARRATPSSSSTTRAAGRTWSWSSASCAGGAAATSSGSKSRPRRRRSWSRCCASGSRSTPDDVYARAGAARPARAAPG